MTKEHNEKGENRQLVFNNKNQFIDAVLSTNLTPEYELVYDQDLTDQILSKVENASNNLDVDYDNTTPVRSMISLLMAASLTGIIFGVHLNNNLKNKIYNKQSQKNELLRSIHLTPPADPVFNPFL